MKIGDIYFKYQAYCGWPAEDDEPAEPPSIECQEFVVRSIKRPPTEKRFYGTKTKKVYLVQKIKGVTWVKKSKSHGDWGWDANVSEFRKSFPVEEKASTHGFGKTKRAAARLELAEVRRRMKSRFRKEDIPHLKILEKRLLSLIKRL